MRSGGLVSSFVGAGGLGFFLPARASSRYRSASTGVGKRRLPGHLVEGGAARVFHPNGTMLPPADTMDGALLYPGGVGDVGDRPDDRIAGMVVRLGGFVLGWGTGGGLGGVGGFGGADGLCRLCGGDGGGGFGFFATGDRRVVTLVARLEGSLSFLCEGGVGGVGLRLGLGGVWRGAGGRPPPSPLSSPSLTPPPPMPPHNPSSSPPANPTSCIRAHCPGRKSRYVTQTHLTTRAVSQSWRRRKRPRPRGGSRATMRCRAPKLRRLFTHVDVVAKRHASWRFQHPFFAPKKSISFFRPTPRVFSSWDTTTSPFLASRGAHIHPLFRAEKCMIKNSWALQCPKICHGFFQWVLQYTSVGISKGEVLLQQQASKLGIPVINGSQHRGVILGRPHIMYLAQSLPFPSKCALENGLPVFLATAVSKKFKTPHFTPIGSHCVTPDKGRMNHQMLVLILCSLEIYCRLFLPPWSVPRLWNVPRPLGDTLFGSSLAAFGLCRIRLVL